MAVYPQKPFARHVSYNNISALLYSLQKVNCCHNCDLNVLNKIKGQNVAWWSIFSEPQGWHYLSAWNFHYCSNYPLVIFSVRKFTNNCKNRQNDNPALVQRRPTLCQRDQRVGVAVNDPGAFSYAADTCCHCRCISRWPLMLSSHAIWSWR